MSRVVNSHEAIKSSVRISGWAVHKWFDDNKITSDAARLEEHGRLTLKTWHPAQSGELSCAV